MSFQQGLSGLDAASKNLDVIGNNVANSNTVGFKESEAQFADVMAASLTGAVGMQIGIGTKVASVAQQFTEGNITSTNNPLDIAINGDGFFKLSNNGAYSWTRNGQFQLDQSGYIVNSTGQRLQGYLPPLNANSQTGDLQISTTRINPVETSTGTAVLNLDSRDTALNSANFNPTDPTTYQNATSMSVYDSLGNSHTLQAYFVKTAANTWDVYATNDGTVVNSPQAPVGTIVFKSDGSIDTTQTSLPFNIPMTYSTGANSPVNIALDFKGTTQYGSNFGVNSLTQSGNADGNLSGFSVSPDGTILGRYTNGQTNALGQVVLTHFPNPQGLLPTGNNQWIKSSTAGVEVTAAPGTGLLGVLQSSAVEGSNVDLTQQLVDMITAQRDYQANAQTIKTQDQVMNTLVNLR